MIQHGAAALDNQKNAGSWPPFSISCATGVLEALLGMEQQSASSRLGCQGVDTNANLAYAVGIPSPPCTEYMCVQPCDHNGSYHLLEWISDRLYFPWAPKSLQMVTAAMKLKDVYFLE